MKLAEPTLKDQVKALRNGNTLLLSALMGLLNQHSIHDEEGLITFVCLSDIFIL